MNLKEIRKENGLTQIDMAKKLKVSLNTYILWERGANNPNEENQQKIDQLIKELKQEDK